MTRHRLSLFLLFLPIFGAGMIWLVSYQPVRGAANHVIRLPDVPYYLPTNTPTPTPTNTSTPTPIPTNTPTPVPNGFPNPYIHGSVGYDLSFPQCGGSPIPATASNGARYAFAVVGVSDGKSFTENPCLGSEAATASSAGLLVSFYMNINAPIGSTAWEGNTGPKGTCATGDDICLSYNYGYNAAQYADSWAISQIGGGGVAGHTWWLDVETANSWFADTGANDQAIQGAIDYLQQQGSGVGVYSIPSMWDYASTVGSAADGSVATSALQVWPLIAGGGFQPSVPSWTSGAVSLSGAALLCGSGSFTGGSTWLTQEPNYFAPNGANYDEDYAC
jgi:hypothetical protein